MIKSIISFCIFTLLCQLSHSSTLEKIDSAKRVNVQVDSLFTSNNKQPKFSQKYSIFTKKEIESPVYQILHASVPLFIAGGVISAFDDDFYSMRGGYIPGFRHRYDDYLQYAPAAIMLTMKAFGVQGRSSWGRMLTSDAFSIGAMVTLVNGLKYSLKRERPDGSARNSFPSGHSATAFMTATMFHKEYGLTRSPLYSLLGYSLATTTAISRQLNNRHWMSDILVGAGIGILSVELGYYFADLIFKEKGLNLEEKRSLDDSYFGNPNHLGIKAGYTFINQTINLINGVSIQSKGGVTAAIEGAWFFNRYLGVGGRISAMNSPLFVDQNGSQNSMEERLKSGYSMKIISISPGLYAYYPLSYGLLIGARIAPSIDLSDQISINKQYSERSVTLAKIDNSINAGFQTGVSITKMSSSNFGISINFDYSAHFAKIRGDGLLHNEIIKFSSRRVINAFTISASASAYLFRRDKK